MADDAAAADAAANAAADAAAGAADDDPADAADDAAGPGYDELTERRIDRGAVDEHRRRPVRRKAGAGRQAMGASAFAGAIALGLQEVFEPVEREEIVQIVDAGQPDPDAPVDLLLVKDAPRWSRARVRPWLLDPPPAATEPGGSATEVPGAPG